MKLRKFKLFHKSDLFLAFLAICALIIFVPIFTYLVFARDLQSKDSIMNRNNTGVTLLDRNGQVFFTFYEAQIKTFVPIAQIPKHTQQAVLAAEDKDFYSHPGFSIKGILGAFVADIKHRRLDYGGSTITQQLVKYSLLNTNKSVLRKYQELVLAQEIERRYSKDEILEMYLNSVYLGQGAFGIEGAAKAYFNKSAKDLDLAESAMIAGILTAPTQYNPISGDAEKALSRQKFVLTEMEQKKFITQEQRQQAESEQLKYVPQQATSFKAPHFALLVKQLLEEKFGEEEIARGGWEVHTTLDLKWQEQAEKIVADQVKSLQRNRVSNGSAVVMDPKNGEVRVMVGSADWNNDKFGKVNIATSLRQPGSSFKPIVYATAMERHIITPATLLKDEPITYNIKGSPPYKPMDYDRKFRGQVTARRALVNSLNIPAIETLLKVGIPPVIETAQKLGITTLDPDGYYGPSFALGVGEVKLLELTNVYATFANNGQRNDITLFTQIKDKQGNLIYNYQPNPQEIITPEVSFQIASILSDNATRAETFGSTLNISRQAAVKTGTTDDYKDALTLGFTPQLAIGAWVGNNDGTPMDQVAGSLGAAPIWKSLMEQLLKGVPEQKFAPPSGMVAKGICKQNGLLLKEATSSGYTEYFIPGTEPKQYCSSGYNPSPRPSTAPGTPNPTLTPPAIPTPTPTSPPADKKDDKKNDKADQKKP